MVVVAVRPPQITGCFEKILCFGLTHPGFDVVKKTYKGEIAKIQPSFLRLLDTYVRHIFGELVRRRRRWPPAKYGSGAEEESIAYAFLAARVRGRSELDCRPETVTKVRLYLCASVPPSHCRLFFFVRFAALSLFM